MDGVGPSGIAAKKDHQNQRVGPRHEKVYQGVLMHPVDLSQQASDAIALDAALNTSARRKPDLDGHVVPNLRSIHDAAQQTHTSNGNGAYVVSRPVKQRADEPPPLQPVRLRKRVAPIRIGLVGARSHKRGLHRLAGVLVAHGQLLAALLAAPLNNLLAFLRLHALQEAVLLLALLVAGLVGALRHNGGAGLVRVKSRNEV